MQGITSERIFVKILLDVCIYVRYYFSEEYVSHVSEILHAKPLSMVQGPQQVDPENPFLYSQFQGEWSQDLSTRVGLSSGFPTSW